jgi:hypothetical protein
VEAIAHKNDIGHVGSYAAKAPSLPVFSVVHGTAAVLSRHKELVALADRTHQSGAMSYLEFYLSEWRPGDKAKIPYLLTLSDPTGELSAAILTYEYRPWGLPSRIFVPYDFYGERNVLAPESMRTILAEQAAQFLMMRGAWLVFVALIHGNFSAESGCCGLNCATQKTKLDNILPIGATFDATVAPMGAHTRRNLRAARRRAQSVLGATFVIDPGLSESEFLAMNRTCLYPVSPEDAQRRFRSLQTLQGRLFAGLRDRDGRWLSLIGGRHHNGTSFIDWQMNIGDLPSFSIGTAARAYLLEHEIERGTSFLVFEGGTLHLMRRAFLQQDVSGLLLARPFLSPYILRNVVGRILPKTNPLAKSMLANTLVWHSPS